MSTLTFAAIEELGHLDNTIPNLELSQMENDTPEELPLPKCMARKSKEMDNTMQQDLHTPNFGDELPLARPMAGRTPNALISEDLPPVRCMGNRSQKGPKIPVGHTVTHQTLVSNEVPLNVPSASTLKRQATVSPDVLQIGKKLWPTPGVTAPVSPDVLPMGKKLRGTPGVSSTPSSYSLAIYDPTNPVGWYNVLMAAHNELRESQIPYAQAVNFHLNANKRRLSQERVMTSELKSLESKLRDLQQVLQTCLNEV